MSGQSLSQLGNATDLPDFLGAQSFVVSQDAANSAAALPLDGKQIFGVTGHPVTSIILGITFKFDSSALFELESACAVDIHVLQDSLAIAVQNLVCERQKIAKKSHIECMCLPIVALCKGDELSAAVILPAHMSMEALMQKAGTTIENTIDNWHKGVQAAASRSDSASTCTAQVPKSSTGHEAQSSGQANADQPSSPATKPDMPPDGSADRLCRSFLGRRAKGDVMVNFVAGGQLTQSSPITVPSTGKTPSDQAYSALGEKIEITARINKVPASGQCEIREEGSSRNKMAVFSTTGRLGMMLKMLAGCPAVTLLVRPYISKEPSAQPRQAFRIEALVGLSPEWEDHGDMLDEFQSCVDCFRSLLQKRVKPEPQ